MKSLQGCVAILLAIMNGPAAEQKGYRPVAADEVTLAQLSPSGWRISLQAPVPREIEIRTLAADRIKTFQKLYVRGDRLVGIGKSSAAEGMLVWDMDRECQVSGGLGHDLSVSPD